MTTIKEWLNANVWDGEGRSGCKTDSAAFNPDELLELVTDCIAATQQQWISVDERLPDDNSIVVAAHFYSYGIGTTPDAAVCWFLHGKFNFFSDGVEAYNYDGVAVIRLDMDVTHWMPLPPEPEK